MVGMNAPTPVSPAPTPVSAYWEILRPFTLLPPFLGIVSGALAAVGSLVARGEGTFISLLGAHWHHILAGGVMSSILNGASNVLNQITEVDLDRQNKPHRILPRNCMAMRAAWIYCLLLYAAALALAWMITPQAGVHHTFWCVVAATVATWIYSVKPLYLKARGWWANLTIAVPRGCLLKVAGWACVLPANTKEPWCIGGLFFLFLLGAASSKDIADLEGDKAGGIRTLPVVHGIPKTVSMIGPFFILPWLLLASEASFHWLHAEWRLLHTNAPVTLVFALALAVYGVWIVRSMRGIDDTSTDGNHPSWKHMYLMMMAAQLGLVGCYLF